jgi:hypothetical protein
MKPLTLGKLSRIVHAKVVFGHPPPLRGELQLVKGMSLQSDQVQPGDVYVHLPGYPKPDEGCWPTEAFMRGAVGLITDNSKPTAWAGAACLVVHDIWESLRRLGCWAAKRRRGAAVLCWGKPFLAMSPLWPRLLHGCLTAQIANATSVARICWNPTAMRCPQVLTLGTHPTDELHLVLTIVRPEIVVLAEPVSDDRWRQLRQTWPALRYAAAVVSPWDNESVSVRWHTPTATQRNRTPSRCSMFGLSLHNGRPYRRHLLFRAPAEITALANGYADDPLPWTAAWLVARLVGIPTEVFLDQSRHQIDSLAEQSSCGAYPGVVHVATDSETPHTELPLASDTRPSATPLTPAMKRRAG